MQFKGVHGVLYSAPTSRCCSTSGALALLPGTAHHEDLLAVCTATSWPVQSTTPNVWRSALSSGFGDALHLPADLQDEVLLQQTSLPQLAAVQSVEVVIQIFLLGGPQSFGKSSWDDDRNVSPMRSLFLLRESPLPFTPVTGQPSLQTHQRLSVGKLLWAGAETVAVMNQLGEALILFSGSLPVGSHGTCSSGEDGGCDDVRLLHRQPRVVDMAATVVLEEGNTSPTALAFMAGLTSVYCVKHLPSGRRSAEKVSVYSWKLGEYKCISAVTLVRAGRSVAVFAGAGSDGSLSLYTWEGKRDEMPCVLRRILMGPCWNPFGIAVGKASRRDTSPTSNDCNIYITVLGVSTVQMGEAKVLSKDNESDDLVLKGVDGRPFAIPVPANRAGSRTADFSRSPLNQVYAMINAGRKKQTYDQFESSSRGDVEELPSLRIAPHELDAEHSEPSLLIIGIGCGEMDTDNSSCLQANVHSQVYSLQTLSCRRALSHLSHHARLLPQMVVNENPDTCLADEGEVGLCDGKTVVVFRVPLLHFTGTTPRLQQAVCCPVGCVFSSSTSRRILGFDRVVLDDGRSHHAKGRRQRMYVLQGTNRRVSLLSQGTSMKCESESCFTQDIGVDGAEDLRIECVEQLDALPGKGDGTDTSSPGPVSSAELREVIRGVLVEENERLYRRLEQRLQRTETLMGMVLREDHFCRGEMERKKLGEARGLTEQAVKLLRCNPHSREAPPRVPRQLHAILRQLLSCVTILQSFEVVKEYLDLYHHISKTLVEVVERSAEHGSEIKVYVSGMPNDSRGSTTDESDDKHRERTRGTLIPPDSGNSPPVASSICPALSDIRWVNVHGCEEAVSALMQATTLPKRFPRLFQGVRKPWQRILLYGPPGTGKTLLASAAAGEYGSHLLSLSSTDLLSKWVGESEKQVKHAFQQASMYERCIIFLDEVDALCGPRGSSGETEASRRLKTELLLHLQTVPPSVTVIAATNLPWEIDSAVRRRFDRLVYVGLPTATARRAVIEATLTQVRSDLCAAEISWLVEDATAGHSMADVVHIVAHAVLNPLRMLLDADAFRMATPEEVQKNNPKFISEGVATTSVAMAGCAIMPVSPNKESTEARSIVSRASRMGVSVDLEGNVSGTKKVILPPRSMDLESASVCGRVDRKRNRKGALPIATAPLNEISGDPQWALPSARPDADGVHSGTFLEVVESVMYVPCPASHAEAQHHLSLDCLTEDQVLLPPVTIGDFKVALELFVPSVSSTELQRYEAWRTRGLS